MTISTRNLVLLPDVDRLRILLQSMAMLDAILSIEWESRYHSFNARWSDGEQMGSMRNGSGDGYFALFNSAGCFLKGFAHEAPMSPFARRPSRVWPGVLDDIPAEFAACLQEPAFSKEAVTFCVWRRYADCAWQHGPVEFPNAPDPDGSESLLSLLDSRPAAYKAWADDYYERDLSLTAVSEIYAHKPLTKALIEQLNPGVSLNELSAEVEESGYGHI